MGLWMEGLDGSALPPTTTTAPTTHDGARKCMTEYLILNNGTVIFHECIRLAKEPIEPGCNLDVVVINIFLILVFVLAAVSIIFERIQSMRLEERKKSPSPPPQPAASNVTPLLSLKIGEVY